MSLVTDLAAYWKLDEASGTRDDAHAANDLTDTNTVTQAAGQVGSAAAFAAPNSEKLTIADNAALSGGNVDLTAVAWVYLTDKSANRSIMSKGINVTTGREYQLFYGSAPDRFVLQVSDGTNEGQVVANTFGSPALNTWYLVGWGHDAANDLIYIWVNDGALDTAAWSTGLLNSAGAFNLGANSAGTGAYWTGRIDEAGFWRRTLTAAERTLLFNGAAGVTYPLPGPLAGAAAGVATATGALSGDGALIGTAAGGTMATGALTGDGALAGAAAGTGMASATLAADGALAGSSAGAATVLAALAADGALAGAAAGVANVAGVLAADGRLVGVSAGQTSVAAALNADGALAGNSAGNVTVAGLLGADGQLVGLAQAAATVAGVLVGDGWLAGMAAGVATVTGALFVESELVFVPATLAGPARIGGVSAPRALGRVTALRQTGQLAGQDDDGQVLAPSHAGRVTS